VSETYIYQFDFGVSPSAPDAVIRMFAALARGETPAVQDRAASRLGTLFDLENRWINDTRPGSYVSLRETGIVNDPANSYHAPEPTHAVRFSYDMSDDHYANGGFALPFAAFELVGQHGLFGTMVDATNRDSMTLFCREFDDMIVQSISIPSMAYPLPPAAKANPAGYLRGWSPATAEGFKLDRFTRVSAAERQAIVADALAMFEDPA
jgi:hypothetical protein